MATDKIHLTVYLPERVTEAVKIAAQLDGLSASRFIEGALMSALERHAINQTGTMIRKEKMDGLMMGKFHMNISDITERGDDVGFHDKSPEEQVAHIARRLVEHRGMKAVADGELSFGWLGARYMILDTKGKTRAL